jgi:hypothetical protein
MLPSSLPAVGAEKVFSNFRLLSASFLECEVLSCGEAFCG